MKYNKTTAFEALGTTQANVRWSWSARSEDGQRVAMTFWQDLFKRDPATGKVLYVDIYPPGDDADEIGSRLGARERVDNLRYAEEHLNGILLPVIAVAHDQKKRNREVKECWPVEKFVMKIVTFNSETGEFIAEQVPIDRTTKVRVPRSTGGSSVNG